MTTLGKHTRVLLRAGAVATVTALAVGLAPGANAADQTTSSGSSTAARRQAPVPIVIGHRGASGYRPEHTLASYQLAMQLGADYVEQDVVSTKDHVLVCRHENDITGTTDVADHPEFADRKTTKVVDGKSITGWFTEDFTLAELKTLRAKERLPQVRPGNTRYDGRFQVPTLDETLDLVASENKVLHRKVGVYVETKHPTYFQGIGLPLEKPLVQTLARHGMDQKGSKVYLQSFETGSLKKLDRLTDLPLIQLTDSSGAPYDLVAKGDPRTYADLTSAQGLKDVATYADGVGPNVDQVLPRDASGATGRPSSLVALAHARGLLVHPFTIRDENQFLPTNYRTGTDPNAKGDVHDYVAAVLDAGVDGFFGDFTDSLVDARTDWLGESPKLRAAGSAA
ncbi:glycerophosphoryl diester phosphodiesterase [Marmoricola endophyticus]|uniref:glycerophosphodiester phosphodiesterase n=1 Tax=Marmoricola endophyticus TaxID=2040280 RepID=A0A917BFA2_9ACTN|nr:glycerophosphodiester phosphodiesterase [Marmoricola endophyticus]GGF37239.1 glycerophosphoryl diester phosphodiesterase [Marmoricola endophyticus]